MIDYTLEDVLDEISVKLILNQPNEDYTAWERIFFKIEESYWLYMDHYLTEYPHLKKFNGAQEFAKTLFEHCPFLDKNQVNFEVEFNNWNKYRERVPVYGTILLNPSKTKLILVNSFGLWAIPKGKINKDETELECSLRETMEEVGFDASSLADPNLFIDSSTQTRKAKYFIIHNVPEDTEFQKTAHEEIIDIRWVDLNGGNGLKLTRLTSFTLKKLKKFLRVKRSKNEIQMRTLVPWVAEEESIGDVLLSQDKDLPKDHDQFKENFMKFGVQSTFDFEDYTVPIDKSLLGNNKQNKNRAHPNPKKNAIVIPDKKNPKSAPKGILLKKNNTNESKVIVFDEKPKNNRKIFIKKNKTQQPNTSEQIEKNNLTSYAKKENNNQIQNNHFGSNQNNVNNNMFPPGFDQPLFPSYNSFSHVPNFTVQAPSKFIEYNIGNESFKVPVLQLPLFNLPLNNDPYLSFNQLQQNNNNLVNFSLDINQIKQSFK